MISINIFNHYDESTSYEEVIISMIEFAYQEMKLENHQIINYILINDQEIQAYNDQYRGINHPTDVLSFENKDFDEEIGDVFISIDRAVEQARAYGHSFERELAFLSLHGYLHCLGYDHMVKDDEIIMFKLQEKIIENSKYRREDHYEQENV